MNTLSTWIKTFNEMKRNYYIKSTNSSSVVESWNDLFIILFWDNFVHVISFLNICTLISKLQEFLLQLLLAYNSLDTFCLWNQYNCHYLLCELHMCLLKNSFNNIRFIPIWWPFIINLKFFYPWVILLSKVDLQLERIFS